MFALISDLMEMSFTVLNHPFLLLLVFHDWFYRRIFWNRKGFMMWVRLSVFIEPVVLFGFWWFVIGLKIDAH